MRREEEKISKIFVTCLLSNNNRTTLPLFNACELKYSDVHEAETDCRAMSHGQEQSDVDVWHSIKIVNKSSAPWTTGKEDREKILR